MGKQPLQMIFDLQSCALRLQNEVMDSILIWSNWVEFKCIGILSSKLNRLASVTTPAPYKTKFAKKATASKVLNVLVNLDSIPYLLLQVLASDSKDKFDPYRKGERLKVESLLLRI